MSACKQLNLYKEEKIMVSIDPERNRYRAYSVELDKTREPMTITKKWGRVENRKGKWQLRNNAWQGEKEEEIPEYLDDFDAEDIWNQIVEMKQKRGYVDYSELVF